MIPKVSIVVPAFNVAKYLPKCLDSLINQSFRDIEIICFNDASTDNTLDILEQYAEKDTRIKVIDSLINVKQGGGRNRGIKASKGEYICFVDSDDWTTNDFVETLYSCAKKNNADIVTADYFESSESVSTEISLLRKDLRESTETLKRKILKNGCRLWSSIFRRNLFFDNNLFFPEGLFYEDNAIGAALFLSASKIIKLDRCIYHYRIDNYSTTRSINNYRLFDRLKTSIMMLDSAKRIDSNSSFTSEIEDLFVRLYYINSIRGCIYGFTTTQSKKIREIRSSVHKYIDIKQLKRSIRNQTAKERLLFQVAAYMPLVIDAARFIKRVAKQSKR